MLIMVIGNNEHRLRALAVQIQSLCPDATVKTYQDPLLAIQYVATHPAQVLFAEIELRVMDGVTLIRTLRRQFPQLRTVLMSPHPEHAKLDVVDHCLCPPITEETLAKLLGSGLLQASGQLSQNH